MNITPYHAKYFAYELTRKCSSSDHEKLNSSILNASIELNPHQVDAALFAFRSPLSRGAILGDEVGLGKTIEAGLIISQLWAERKRKILCITPASLRQQWQKELWEKFFIRSIILEGPNYKEMQKEGIGRPFEQENAAVICSYHFARAKSTDIMNIFWDLVVIDEAHRLRNVYKKENKIARAIHNSVANSPKVLLTATPLQNSLMELYGLISFIDPHVFGSVDSFRDQYVTRPATLTTDDFSALRRRLQPICQRTLRRQVKEYVRYTNRNSVTQDFTPTDEEVRLYEAVSEYLQKADSFALPKGQRGLMTLVLRKILASSSFAIADTLKTLMTRLEDKMKDIKGAPAEDLSILAEEYEITKELQEEWEDGKAEEESSQTPPEEIQPDKRMELEAIKQETLELKSYHDLARRILTNAKGEALLDALRIGFNKMAKIGAKKKALVFTESQRTQNYLFDLLKENGYTGQIVMLNGSNTEPICQEIYRNWLERHKEQECITGQKSVDMRASLVEEFEVRASIMIATESGAEGLNFQFCSLVVNYDLPWNPQRIEQRIGRCHRYGQKHDVVVINFINRRNDADRRVFDLLSQKLRLFDGVFGTSDEVLGILESGMDFEKRIHSIYQTCRTAEDINAAFDQLQLELEDTIKARMADTRAKILEHFDEEVHARFKACDEETKSQLDRFENLLWWLTEHELGECADFKKKEYFFDLKKLPEGCCSEDVILGTYRLVTHKNGVETHNYRLNHPLSEFIINRCKEKDLAPCEVTFNISDHETKVSVIENLKGQSGWLSLNLLSVTALEREEKLLFAGVADDGKSLDSEVCAKFFIVGGEEGSPVAVAEQIREMLKNAVENDKAAIIENIAEKNQAFFEAEMEKIEDWSEDLKDQLEHELKELDKEIKAHKREARKSTNLDEKVALHKKAKEIERRRNDKRKSLFDAQDEIEKKKEVLIGNIEAKLRQSVEMEEIFTIRWKVA